MHLLAYFTLQVTLIMIYTLRKVEDNENHVRWIYLTIIINPAVVYPVQSFDPVTMEAMTVNHVAPATSSKTYINPSLVMYYLDPTTFTLVDYESFHLEIKDQEQSIG